ncbi:Os02g0462500, partial [Oryza sativa Japonica Group]
SSTSIFHSPTHAADDATAAPTAAGRLAPPRRRPALRRRPPRRPRPSPRVLDVQVSLGQAAAAEEDAVATTTTGPDGFVLAFV